MANVKFPRKEFEKYVKLTPKMQEQIHMFGTPLESLTKDEIEIEIFPNRPDLLSMHGYLRAFLGFLGKKKGLKQYKINKPEKDYQITIDKSVLEVRPYTACAIIKNIKFTDDKIKEVIDIQEKIHNTFGRNRKKIAIGIYPLEKIKLPIKYLAEDPNKIKFVPLEANKEMTGKQILSQLSTGRDYAHLLRDKKEYPIFTDANNEILSMPPIINSHKTGKISEKTKDIFIECSGFDINSLKKTLNILVTMFADLGGEIYQMNIKHPKTNYTTPDLTPEKAKLDTNHVNKLLGIKLDDKQIKNNLEKMGYNYNKGNVEIPAWRTDILHEHDIIEDVAIAYGYDNFTPEIPEVATIGQENPIEISKRKISQILQGLNMLETSSYHLTTKDSQFKKTNKKPENIIEIEDSKTEYNIIRQDLIHYALKILSENNDAEYPQQIFELGRIFSLDKKAETGIKESENLCVSIASPTTNFTEIKQILDYLMRMLDKEYRIENSENSYFIDGRCGKIIVNKKEIGFIGEINPNILSNLKIKMPISSFEINIDELLD